MSSDQIVREQLLALLRGGNAYFPFERIIAEFPAQHYNSKAPNVSYSPWHILEHLRRAQWDILEFIRNPAHISPDWPEGYWPAKDEQAGETRWQQTIANFKADLQALQDIVTNPETDLYAPLPHATGYTILREILVVADHNAYHIGEFAVLRQVMNNWPAG